jgi:NAD(P)-dependent dehydrogenase (short-subunit alcohol dehydrogenase family)
MMKSIKNLAVVILIGVVLVVGVSAYGQISMTDQQRFLRRQLETTKISNQIATAQAWGQIRLALVYVAGGTLGILMVAGSGLILSFVGKYTRTLRAVDGLYPVIVERPGLFARLQGKRDPIVVDPNKQTGPVARYREVPGGVQMIAPIDNEATQATATAAAQRVQMVQAMNSGRMSAAAGRFFAGAYDPRQPATVLDEPPALAAPQQEPAFLDRLIANPSQNGEIVLGQAEARGFERATWRPVAVPHLAIWGSTQQGKTTGMGYTVAMQLIAAGHHVVIIDPEEEANWAKLDGWAEYHPTDPAQFPAQIAALAEEYERRGSVLARYGAPNWVKLPDRSGERRMVLIVEEYGRIRTQAGDYGNLAEIDRVMGELATRGGKRGMHMVLVDQHYKGQWGKWPDPVFNNIGARATFRQPKEDNSLVGYHGLAFLGVGNFAYEGRTFNTFHAEPHVAKLMANVPALDARPLLGVSSSGSSAVRSFVGWEAPPPSGRSTPPSTEPPNRTNRRTSPPGPWRSRKRPNLCRRHGRGLRPTRPGDRWT